MLPATAPTTNKHLIRWVEKMAELCQPDRVQWIDGSQAEYDRLCEQLVAAGTFTRLNQKLWPGCFYAVSYTHLVSSSSNPYGLSQEIARRYRSPLSGYAIARTVRRLV